MVIREGMKYNADLEEKKDHIDAEKLPANVVQEGLKGSSEHIFRRNRYSACEQ